MAAADTVVVLLNILLSLYISIGITVIAFRVTQHLRVFAACQYYYDASIEIANTVFDVPLQRGPISTIKRRL